MTELVATNIQVIADGTTLIEDASLSFRTGELVAILGPNGAGKTSLLRAILGLVPPASGSAAIDGKDCSRLAAADRAKLISYLPQRRPLAWPNKVRDIVALGRFAHGAALGKLREADQAAVNEALTVCDLESLADRAANSLSGGELARVHFARAIAAYAPLLVADEPVAALDPRHQLRIEELLRSFVDHGGGALVVLHEVALAARMAGRLIWMKNGQIVADGTPDDTLTEQTMALVYGVRARVDRDSEGVDVRVLSTL